MSCIPDPTNPRTPCNACPDPEQVVFPLQGQFTDVSHDMFNTNFTLLQCVLDLCPTLNGGGSGNDGGPYTVTAYNSTTGVVTVTDDTSTESFDLTLTVGTDNNDGSFTLTLPDGTSKDLQCENTYLTLGAVDPVPAANGTIQWIKDVVTGDISYWVLPDGTQCSLPGTDTFNMYNFDSVLVTFDAGTPPAAPTKPADLEEGRMLLECFDNGTRIYECVGGLLVDRGFKNNAAPSTTGNTNSAILTPVPLAPPVTPVSPPAVIGDFHIHNEIYTDCTVQYTTSNGGTSWTLIQIPLKSAETTVNVVPLAVDPTATGNVANLDSFVTGPTGTLWFVGSGGNATEFSSAMDSDDVTTSDETGASYNLTTNPGPANPPTGVSVTSGDTHQEEYDNGKLLSFYNGTVWSSCFIPTSKEDVITQKEDVCLFDLVDTPVPTGGATIPCATYNRNICQVRVCDPTEPLGFRVELREADLTTVVTPTATQGFSARFTMPVLDINVDSNTVCSGFDPCNEFVQSYAIDSATLGVVTPLTALVDNVAQDMDLPEGTYTVHHVVVHNGINFCESKMIEILPEAAANSLVFEVNDPTESAIPSNSLDDIATGSSIVFATDGTTPIAYVGDTLLYDGALPQFADIDAYLTSTGRPFNSTTKQITDKLGNIPICTVVDSECGVERTRVPSDTVANPTVGRLGNIQFSHASGFLGQFTITSNTSGSTGVVSGTTPSTGNFRQQENADDLTTEFEILTRPTPGVINGCEDAFRINFRYRDINDNALTPPATTNIVNLSPLTMQDAPNGVFDFLEAPADTFTVQAPATVGQLSFGWYFNMSNADRIALGFADPLELHDGPHLMEVNLQQLTPGTQDLVSIIVGVSQYRGVERRMCNNVELSFKNTVGTTVVAADTTLA